MASKCRENEISRQIQNVMAYEVITKKLVSRDLLFSEHSHIVYHSKGLSLLIIFD